MGDIGRHPRPDLGLGEGSVVEVGDEGVVARGGEDGEFKSAELALAAGRSVLEFLGAVEDGAGEVFEAVHFPGWGFRVRLQG